MLYHNVNIQIFCLIPNEPLSGYQTTEYKAEPVRYSAFHAHGVPYFSACHCLSSLDLNILRVVAATVHSESEFQLDYSLTEHVLANFKPTVTHE